MSPDLTTPQANTHAQTAATLLAEAASELPEDVTAARAREGAPSDFVDTGDQGAAFTTQLSLDRAPASARGT